jgi:hypothetical protein
MRCPITGPGDRRYILNVAFTRVWGPAGLVEYRRVESELGTRLPPGYREFLGEIGGGRPAPNECLTPAGQRLGLSVTKFFCADDLLARRSDWSDLVPKDLLVIAEAKGGNLICISRRGSVYFWDHEKAAPPGQAPDYRNLTKIAHSFKEFEDNLVPFVPKAPPPRSHAEGLTLVAPEMGRGLAKRK